jgi:hypothetical protein
MVVMFVIVVSVVYGTFRTIPTVESYEVLRGFSTVTVGDPAQDLSKFQMAPIPILIILTCSTS